MGTGGLTLGWIAEGVNEPMSDWVWAWIAFAAAAFGVLSSVGLSVVLKLRACPLCIYQRSAVMGTASVLLIGLSAAPEQVPLLCLVCWPIHVTGLGVALYHIWLVQRRVLECPRGIGGLGTATHQSLLFFLLAALPLLLGADGSFALLGFGVLGGILLSTLLGLVLAYLCILSSPPLPPVPTQMYDPMSQPLDTCRPPFRGLAAAGDHS